MDSRSQDAFRAPALSQSESLDLPEQIAEWTLEPELAYGPPRPAVPKMRFSGTWYWLIVFLILGGLHYFLSLRGTQTPLIEWQIPGFLLGMALLVYIFITFSRKPSKLFVTQGLATRGTVVRVESNVSDATDYERANPPASNDCVVAYDTPSRRFLTFADYGLETKVGDTLTILYLPESPETARPYKLLKYRAVAPWEVRST